jgi:hypothetical protein
MTISVTPTATTATSAWMAIPMKQAVPRVARLTGAAKRTKKLGEAG